MTLKHGGRSALKAARLDRRTPEWREENRIYTATVAALGGSEKVTEAGLIRARHHARLEVMATIAYGAAIRDGDVIGAAGQHYLALARESRAVLDGLDLGDRRAGEKSLREVLNKGAR